MKTIDVTAELGEQLRELAAEQDIKYRTELDETAPMPWAVWYTTPDGDEDILGAGESLDEALQDAVEQLRAWG